MGEMIFMAHSGVRYLVLLTAVIALVLAALSLKPGVLSRAGYAAARAFVVVLDIQVLLGIATVFLRPFAPAYMGHIVMMVLAAGLAHAVAVAVKRRPADARPPGMLLAGIAGALALMIAGILAIGRPII